MNAKLVPSCGVLLGIQPGAASLDSIETAIGRKFDLVKKYKDFSGSSSGAGSFLTPSERSEAASGHILFYAWVTKLYVKRAPSQPAPQGKDSVYTYAQITSGQLDHYIDGVARTIKAFGKPVFFSFNHEPDVTRPAFDRVEAGSNAQFAAAYRHIVSRFRADGATNAVWAFVVSGYQKSDDVYRQLYPGDAYVDWIGWDPYLHDRSNWQPPTTVFGRFYKRLDAGLLGATAAAKPRMLGEYGVTADPRRPVWFSEVPAALAALPKLKLIQYFNSGSWGKFFPGDRASTVAFANAADRGVFADIGRP